MRDNEGITKAGKVFRKKKGTNYTKCSPFPFDMPPGKAGKTHNMKFLTQEFLFSIMQAGAKFRKNGNLSLKQITNVVSVSKQKIHHLSIVIK